MFRILAFLLLPVICLAQVNSNGEKPTGELLSNEISPNDMKRNASFNLDEIKVRWKKAALENCTGVPCITTTAPGAPTAVVATASIASASVAFEAPSNTGGSAITGYTVTSNPGNITESDATSPINVTGLMNGQVYTFTVVATNVVGNSLASTASAGVTPAAPSSCPTLTITDVDGNIYKTVSIGTQCWINSNLKVTKYNDMTAIPLDATGGPSGTSGSWAVTTGAYSIYANVGSSGANATNYGYLYNWYASKGIATIGSTTYKNICPTGYHVPTDSDWNKLVIFVDPSVDTTFSLSPSTQTTEAGTVLKKKDALWTPKNIGTDDYGFSALPGGLRLPDGQFLLIGNLTYFWNATALDDGNAWYRDMNNDNGGMNRNSDFKSYGFSVRCLKD